MGMQGEETYLEFLYGDNRLSGATFGLPSYVRGRRWLSGHDKADLKSAEQEAKVQTSKVAKLSAPV